MKIKDLDFSAYTYSRIGVMYALGGKFFPPGAEEAVKRALGETELVPDGGIEVTDEGWLLLYAEKKADSTKPEQ